MVERPQQLNFKVDEGRLENLYSIPVFNKLSQSIKNNPQEKENGIQLQNKIIQSLKNIPNNLIKSYNEFDKLVSDELGSFDISPSFKRNIIEKLSEHDNTAEYVKDSEEINFTRYFYKYTPPRPLKEIEHDIKRLQLKFKT
ncbi:MAG: hypothetical protein LBC39_00015 [Methanobrevibacter sp.]|jgi:type I restriction enzyme M protein|nr:hypothetical protein [Candidatus Methanovirga aequatorialis]